MVGDPLINELQARRQALMKHQAEDRAALSEVNWELAGREAETSGYTQAPAPRRVTAPVYKPPGKPLWGKVVAGVGTIIKYAVVAVVLFSAYHLAAGMLDTTFPTFFATVNSYTSQAYNFIASNITSLFNDPSKWLGDTMKSLHMASAGGDGLMISAGTGGAIAGAAIVKHQTAHNATQLAANDPNSLNNVLNNMPDELALDAAKHLGGHSEAALAKAAHVSTDSTAIALEQRAVLRSQAAERIIAARQNGGTWAERVAETAPKGPASIV